MQRTAHGMWKASRRSLTFLSTTSVEACPANVPAWRGVPTVKTSRYPVRSPFFLSADGGGDAEGSGEAESVERECSGRLSRDCSSCR